MDKKLIIAESHPCIVDSRPLEVLDIQNVISESIQNGKKKQMSVMRVTGVFQEAETPNANSRIYPKNVLEHAVASLQNDLNARRVLGEFDHPSDAKLHLDRVSHLITKLWVDNNRVLGEAEILEFTTYGQQLKGLLMQGVTVGVSSRGVGDMESVTMEGKQYFKVLDGYNLITFDAVAEPSVSGTDLSVMESRIRARNNVREASTRKHIEHNALRALTDYLRK